MFLKQGAFPRPLLPPHSCPPSWRRGGRPCLLQGAQRGQGRWGLWKCVGEHMASGENIYIHGGGAGEDSNKVIPQRFQAGDSQTPYSVSGLDTTEKSVLFRCFSCLLSSSYSELLQFAKGAILSPQLRESRWTFPGPAQRPAALPPPACDPQTRIQSHSLAAGA